MIIDFSNNEKIEESKKLFFKKDKIDNEDIFILQHISVNNDKCQSIIKYGILNRKELLKHEDFEIVQRLKENKKKYKIIQEK